MRALNRRESSFKIRAIIIAVLFLLVALVSYLPHVPSGATVPSSQDKVEQSADGGTVRIHMYSPSASYEGVYLWSWLKGGDGTPTPIAGSATADEIFKMDNNSAQVFYRTVTATELESLQSGTLFGFLVCATSDGSNADWGWNNYSKETEDIFVDLSTAFSGGVADIYYVRGSSSATTDVEEAMVGLQQIVNARMGRDFKTVTMKASAKVSEDAVASIYQDGELVQSGVSLTSVSADGLTCEAVFAIPMFDIAATYEVELSSFAARKQVVDKDALIDTLEFIKTFETAKVQESALGAIFSESATLFRLWAPFASSVKVNLYRAGDGDNLIESLDMVAQTEPTRDSTGASVERRNGLWEVTKTGNLHGTYYTYTVVNGGAETETADPNALTTGVNGDRAMVIDLDSTDPDGWEDDAPLFKLNPEAADTPIVWEVHVRDFSSSSDSGMINKGKYLAFTEKNTSVPGRTDLKTGINYLKDLGITYVHLNPVYDFATVDEGALENADSTDLFNWGYDPQNYNVPEGSYSTDPYHGEVRVNEFKRMVQALHEAGIGVIMDVVYNHTFSVSGQPLNDTVPGYYHRSTAEGVFTDGSGCGNETATERAMMRKYLIDSVLYWQQEYHIDGFRFDLMGIHDKVTLEILREKMDALYDGEGKKLLIYGEPWSADSAHYFPASYDRRVKSTLGSIKGTGEYTINANNNLIKNIKAYDNVTSLPKGVAVFSDSIRDAIRGNNNPGQGYVNGSVTQENYDKLIRAIEGGSSVGSGLYMQSASQQVAYAAAHDNYTLYDQMVGKSAGTASDCEYSSYNEDAANKTIAAASVYMMSNGISFMLAGEEMGRTKYGNHNSYNSPDGVNQIIWTRQEEFAKIYTAYKAMIAARKHYRSEFFSYQSSYERTFSNGRFNQARGNSAIDFTRTRTTGDSSVSLHYILNETGGDIVLDNMQGKYVFLLNNKGHMNALNPDASVTLYSGCAIIFGTKA